MKSDGAITNSSNVLGIQKISVEIFLSILFGVQISTFSLD